MNIRIIAIASLLIALPVSAQKKKTVVNDSNTPLHLLQPAYQGTYGDLTPEQVKKEVDRVFAYIDKETPARVVDKNTGKVITNYTTMGEEAQLERGAFRLASYEWGVTYSALIAASEATGDTRYMDYVQNRFRFLAEVAPHFKRVYKEKGTTDPQLLQILTPHALDDAGAVCAAMVKVRLKDPSLPVDELIRNYFDFIINKEYRLADGTFARNRPQHNTLWLDDMFMGIPAVAQMSYYDKGQKNKYLAEAVRQFLQFADRMFIPEKGLYRHGWVESSSDHPAFCWARANGWAMLTACELLDVLPEDYPQRAKVMDYFRAHVRGVTALQSGEGLWHQLLDRNDSYLETSATAIYVYCLAHAINKGWIDAIAYGPVTHLGWHAVAGKINAEGKYDEVKKNGLENFKRDTMWVAVMDTIYPKGFNADSMKYIPYGNGAIFEMNVKNDTAKSGAPVYLFEVKAPYETYLGGLDRQEIINLKDLNEKLGRYSGLMVGSIDNPNNGAGNWE